MDIERMEELARDPRFIPGIYNYCDRWCERCAFTSRCMNYAIAEEELNSPESRDVENEAFWDKLNDIFEATTEMLLEKADELGVDLDFDEEEFEEYLEEEEQVREEATSRPCNRAAKRYSQMVDDWFKANESLLEARSEELETLAQADIPGARPVDEAASIHDCLEVIRWYQPQIYVKLCRAATGMIRAELNTVDYTSEDASGSAKVAIIGIERSIAAWATLLTHFPDQEHTFLDLLANLKRLLRSVETTFPDARAFLRPGFDTDEG